MSPAGDLPYRQEPPDQAAHQTNPDRVVNPDGTLVERRKPSGTGTHTSLPSAAAMGAATGAAVRNAMDNGLGGGMIKTMTNMTAVAFVCFMFYLVFDKWNAAQKEDRIMWQDRERQSREAESQSRASTNAEIRALTTEVRASNELMRAALQESQRHRKE